MPLGQVERALGHVFEDRDLLEEALTHPSAVGTGSRRAYRRSNQRLEFLGDRVLGLLVAELLFEAFPDEQEGDLTHRHLDLVKRDALVGVAEGLNAGEWLRLSPGEASKGGRAKPSVLGDLVEALLGALYVDGGTPAARAFVRQHWGGQVDPGSEAPRDAKQVLQEWAQSQGLGQPGYREVERRGSAHQPVFVIAVEVPGYERATGEAGNKRAAERAAAQAMLRVMGHDELPEGFKPAAAGGNGAGSPAGGGAGTRAGAGGRHG